MAIVVFCITLRHRVLAMEKITYKLARTYFLGEKNEHPY